MIGRVTPMTGQALAGKLHKGAQSKAVTSGRCRRTSRGVRVLGEPRTTNQCCCYVATLVKRFCASRCHKEHSLVCERCMVFRTWITACQVMMIDRRWRRVVWALCTDCALGREPMRRECWCSFSKP
jgi:hypothetical protein